MTRIPYRDPGNFPAGEWTFSQTATRKGIANVPDHRQWRVISDMSREVCQPARDALGPLRISSGYRSPDLNIAIGGSRRSDHCIPPRPAGPFKQTGAVDLIPLKATLWELWLCLYRLTPWAKIIWEFDRWVHVSYCTNIELAKMQRYSMRATKELRADSGRQTTKYEVVTPTELATSLGETIG